ncbi:hypothetical protein CDAR_579471 [Caerostris darwini]|uniref:Uncharacterized protein n=1 Tax=Caerostris darwini TaxID=1538125 RepID=A0AAV4V322_9ARAC|nr:hypothetical protein CDAR_579471 [Caerostris darwini]
MIRGEDDALSASKMICWPIKEGFRVIPWRNSPKEEWKAIFMRHLYVSFRGEMASHQDIGCGTSMFFGVWEGLSILFFNHTSVSLAGFLSYNIL